MKIEIYAASETNSAAIMSIYVLDDGQVFADFYIYNADVARQYGLDKYDKATIVGRSADYVRRIAEILAASDKNNIKHYAMAEALFYWFAKMRYQCNLTWEQFEYEIM